MKSASPRLLGTSRRLTSRLAWGWMAVFAVVGTVSAIPLHAAGPRVLSEGSVPKDSRLAPPKDLNGYFPFTPSKSTEDWAKRAERVRRQILVSQGLWPMPTKTPLNAVVHGKVDRSDYTVERVYFESFPGFYVTGSLYRPKDKTGPLPGVLCPHGHWANGRFYDQGVNAVRNEIVNGAERFEEGGRSPLQARCMQLARMGCVVFHYDMLGYADSQQLSFDLVHRFAKQRPEMNSIENWGLYSPQAESRLQSVMGLQTWNSVRSLDFITSLPDVDASRIAVTGASGGGTQTMILGAIDPRCTVTYPAVMVSTAMQGGCTCENASCLRVGTGNVEFAAMFAPKPQGMSAANDWTKEMETKGFPDLQKHYDLFGAKQNVFLKATTYFGHNYNYVNREAMYGWFNKHLKLGLKEPVIEEDYQRLSEAEMTVWDEKHPRPEGGVAFERKLVRQWTDDSEKQLAAAAPKNAESLAAFREVVGGGIDAILHRNLPPASAVEYDQTHKTDKKDYILMAGMLRNKPQGEELPICFLHPKKWEGQVVIWIHPDGKAGLFDAAGEPKPEIRMLLTSGVSVVGADLLYQGEFLKDGKPLATVPLVKNPREFAGFTYGYNYGVFASRVHDILTVITFVRNHELAPKRISIVGLEGNAGPLVAAARAQARDAVHGAVVNTNGFRFAKLNEFTDPNFLPGGAKYGDLPGQLAVAAPAKLLIAGEGASVPSMVQAAYQAAGAGGSVTNVDGNAEAVLGKTMAWLLTP